MRIHKISTKKTTTILYVVLYITFLVLMDYNFIARMINENIQGDVVSRYPVGDSSLSISITQERLKAEEYNQKMADGTYPSLANQASFAQIPYGEYESILNIRNDDTIGSIVIPSIDVNLPVYHGTSEEVLQKGAGHIQGTSFPVGGDNTHAAISAHCGLPDKIMFTYLSQLKTGDKFFINVLDETIEYEVYSIQTVLPYDTSDLAIESGKDLCTLVTCTPYGVNSHRLLVHGKRTVPFVESDISNIKEKPSAWFSKNWWIIATIVMVLMMFFTIFIYFKK